MATKMWVWKNPNTKTQEKGVIMFLRIHSYFKWKTKTLTCKVKEIKNYYNFILGEHLEVTNPSYDRLFKDYYQQCLPDFDLWFYSCDRSKKHVLSKSKNNELENTSMKMSAISYLIDQNFWTIQNMKKRYSFCLCCNDLLMYKRPDWALSFFNNWPSIPTYPQKMAIIYKNISKDVEYLLKKYTHLPIDFINNPEKEKIKQIYNESCALIHPSTTESGPRVIGEAISCGIPVIVPKTPWLESITNLMPACMILDKLDWKNGNVLKTVEFINKYKTEDKRKKIRKLVNTTGNLHEIDVRLSKINNVWTLGDLQPPNWVGSKSTGLDNDNIFKQITNQNLT